MAPTIRVGDASNRTGIPARRLYDLIEKGDLPAWLKGGYVHVDVDDPARPCLPCEPSVDDTIANLMAIEERIADAERNIELLCDESASALLDLLEVHNLSWIEVAERTGLSFQRVYSLLRRRRP